MKDEEFEMLWKETTKDGYAGKGDSPYTQEFLDSWRNPERRRRKTGEKEKDREEGEGMDIDTNITLVKEKERTLAEEVADLLDPSKGRADGNTMWIRRFYNALATCMAGRYLDKGIGSIDAKEVMLLQALGSALIADSKGHVDLNDIASELFEIREAIGNGMKGR